MNESNEPINILTETNEISPEIVSLNVSDRNELFNRFQRGAFNDKARFYGGIGLAAGGTLGLGYLLHKALRAKRLRKEKDDSPFKYSEDKSAFVSGLWKRPTTHAGLKSPEVAKAIGFGVPAALIGSLALKNTIDNLYQEKDPEEERLQQLRNRFQRLLNQEYKHSSEDDLNYGRIRSFLEALEDKYDHEKDAAITDWYTSWLPAIFGTTALGSGYLANKYFMRNDPARIKAKAQKDAYRRYRMLKNPAIHVLDIDRAREEDELDDLDNISRNVVPLLLKRKKVKNESEAVRPIEEPVVKEKAIDDAIAKMSEDASLEKSAVNISSVLASMSPSQFGTVLNGVIEKNPNLAQQAISHMQSAMPMQYQMMTNQFGNSPEQIMSGVVDQLRNPSGLLGGFKARKLKSAIVDNIQPLGLTPAFQSAMQVTQPGLAPVVQGAQATIKSQPKQLAVNPQYATPATLSNVMNKALAPTNINPYQALGAAGALGLGFATDRPGLGALGAGAALFGPQLYQGYKNYMANKPSLNQNTFTGDLSNLFSNFGFG